MALYFDYQNKNKPLFIKFFDLFMKYDANPFIVFENKYLEGYLYRNSKDFKAQIDQIEKKFPHVSKELKLRSNFATIAGQKFKTDIYGSEVNSRGGNYSFAVYKMLKDQLIAFSKLPPATDQKDSKISEFFVPLLNVVNNALEIIYGAEDINLAQRIYEHSQTLPVIIPSGWSGHAIAIIIYKDLLIKLNKGNRSKDVISGARFYKFSASVENILKIRPLIKFHAGSNLKRKEGKKFFDYGVDKKIGLTFIGQKEEPKQCVGNCTWESSASFALQLALAILKVEDFENKNAEQLVNAMLAPRNSSSIYDDARSIIDNFKSFAAYNMVKQYINDATTLVQTNCLIDTGILTQLLSNEIDKVQSNFIKKDHFRLKMIDEILTSGLPLKDFKETFSLYGKYDPSLSNEENFNIKALKIKFFFKTFYQYEPSFSWSKSVSDKDKENLQKLHKIFDAENQATPYPWGQCF